MNRKAGVCSSTGSTSAASRATLGESGEQEERTVCNGIGPPISV